MERTIVIENGDENIEIPVKASMGSLSLYRATFNEDLIRDLNEIYRKLHPDPFMDAMQRAKLNPNQMDQEALASAILENVDYSTLDDESVLPDGGIQMKALQIVWAMAKTADDSLGKFEKWCDRFEFLPIRGMVDCCHEIWQKANATTVKIKN